MFADRKLHTDAPPRRPLDATRRARLFELLRQQDRAAHAAAALRAAPPPGDVGSTRRLRDRALRSLSPAADPGGARV